MVDIESSYRENHLGRTLHQLVLAMKPDLIVEFGVLYGYSSICMALALQKLGHGRIIACDLWNDYAYKHGDPSIVNKNLKQYGVEDYVELHHVDFNEWLADPTSFDLLHVDISNDGSTYQQAFGALKDRLDKGAVLVMEGGTAERDQVEWMKLYGKVPIERVKEEVGYEILDPAFPALSIMRGA